MDGFDAGLDHGDLDTHGAFGRGVVLDHGCPGLHDGMGHADPHDALIESLTVAHVAHGMDPVDAALQARLQAPLIPPLF